MTSPIPPGLDLIAGTLFEHAPERAFVMDPRQNRVMAANDAGCALLSYTRDEMIGPHVARIHPSEMHELSALLTDVARNGRASTISLTCRTKTGTFLPTEISLHAIPADGGICILGLIQDRSEHRQRAPR